MGGARILALLLSLLLIVLLVQVAAAHRVRHTIERLVHRLASDFESEGVDYWVDFGTLLGIVRDRRAIMGDNDADVCILDTPENHERVQRVVRRMGGRWLDWGAYRVYGDFETVHADIYVVKDRETSYENPTGDIADKGLILPLRKQRVELGGQVVLLTLPNDAHGLLQHRYGQGWRLPRRTWRSLYFDTLEEEWWKKDWWRLTCLTITVAALTLLFIAMQRYINARS